MENSSQPPFVRSAFLFLLLVWMGGLLWWHRVDTRPASWDESVHLNLALDYKEALSGGKAVTTSWASIYPPLYHYSLIPALSVGHPSQARAVLTHLFYVALLIWAMVALAGGMGRPAWMGGLAVLIVLACPISLYTARRPLIDFALMAWVTAGMVFLQRTRGFSDRRATLLWGVVSGFGMLMKPFYGMWFILPCVDLLLRERRWKNFSYAVGILVLVCLPWYGRQGVLFFQHAAGLSGSTGAAEGDPAWTSLAGWLYYLKGLDAQVGTVLLALVLGGIVLDVAWRRHPSSRLLALWWLSGYLAFTFSHNKDLRYTLPGLPPLALAAVMGIFPFGSVPLRLASVAALITGTLVWNLRTVDRPLREDWKHAEIARALLDFRDKSQPFLLASVLANHPDLFGRTLRWSMRAGGHKLETVSCGDERSRFPEFIVRKTGDTGPGSEGLRREWDRLEASGRAFSAVYPERARFSLPDGSQAVLYQRDPGVRFHVGSVSRAQLQTRIRKSLADVVEGPIQVRIDGTPGEWSRGWIRSAVISGGPWRIKGVPVERAEIRVEGAQLNLYDLWEHGSPGLMRFERLSPAVTLRLNDLVAALAPNARGVQRLQLQAKRGDLMASATWKRIPVRAKVRLSIEEASAGSPRQLVATVRWVQLAFLRLPGWLFGKVYRQVLPLDPIPTFPGAIQIRRIQADDGVLSLTP